MNWLVKKILSKPVARGPTALKVLIRRVRRDRRLLLLQLLLRLPLLQLLLQLLQLQLGLLLQELRLLQRFFFHCFFDVHIFQGGD